MEKPWRPQGVVNWRYHGAAIALCCHDMTIAPVTSSHTSDDKVTLALFTVDKFRLSTRVEHARQVRPDA